MTRAPRIAAIVVAGLVLFVGAYAALGYWAVPRVLVSQLQAWVAADYALEAGFERVSFDPFALRLEIDGFRLTRSDEAPAASLAELRVDLAVAPLLSAGVVVDELRLHEPLIELRIDPSGGLEIAGFPIGGDSSDTESPGDRQGEGETPPEPGPGGSPISDLLIRQLGITDGRLRVVDASRQPTVERTLGPIELSTQDLDLADLLRADPDPDDGSSAELTIELADGSSLSASGDVDVDPLQLEIDLHLADYPLASLQPYIEDVAKLELRGGRMQVEGRLELGTVAEAPDRLRFAGKLAIDSLDVVEPGREETGAEAWVGWKQLTLSGIDVTTQPLNVAIGGVALAEPVLRLRQTPDGLDLARAFEAGPETGEGEAGDASGDVEGPAPSLRVGAVAIRDGSVRFEDRSVAMPSDKPVWAIDLLELKVDVDRFETDPDSRSKIEVSAEADGYAPIRLAGTLAPLSPREHLDLHFSADALELAGFSPYAGRFIGRQIDGGRGSADLVLRVEKQQLSSRTQIVLDQVDFGESVDSPDATSLPVPAAIRLSADANGRVDVDVPVEGRLDDPSFSYTGTLLATLRRMTTRIVATPYKLLDGVVSAGGALLRPDDMRFVAFEAGDDDFESDEQDKLEVVAEMLREMSGAELEIHGAADPALDGDGDLRALARRRARAVSRYLEERGVDAGLLRSGRVRVGPVDEDMRERAAGQNGGKAQDLVFVRLSLL